MSGFASGTKLLTPTGWVDVSEINEGCSVAQYISESGEVEFVKPQILPDYLEEEMYEIVHLNGSYRQIIAGGSRIYHWRETRKSSKEWVSKVVTAKDLYYTGIRSDLTRFISGGLKTSGASNLSAIERFRVGMNKSGKILEDGVVQLYAKGPERQEHLEEVLAELDFQWEKDVATYAIFVPESYRLGSYSLSLWVDFSRVSATWTEDLLLEFAMWGHRVDGQGLLVYSSKDSKDIEALTGIMATSGFFALPTVREGFLGEKTYVVPFRNKGYTVSGDRLTINRVDSQQVYPIRVPSTFVLTHNGRSTVISGTNDL